MASETGYEQSGRYTAVVFPGQGSQCTGMGADIVLAYPEARRIFARASEAIGIDLAEVCFAPNDRLDSTEFAQPAILTVEIALFRVLQAYGFSPRIFAGHSLGEYSALVAAGVLSLEDAVVIVRERGRLMASAMPRGMGAMVAVISAGLDFSAVENAAREAGCEVANYNSTEQVVLSGDRDSVRRASHQILVEFPDARVVELNVSLAFHSRFMQSIELPFRLYLESFRHNLDLTNVRNVLSNQTGHFHRPDDFAHALVRQISEPVRWLDNMRVITHLTRDVVEIGPQRVLGRFFGTLGISVTSVTGLRSLERVFPEGGAHAA